MHNLYIRCTNYKTEKFIHLDDIYKFIIGVLNRPDKPNLSFLASKQLFKITEH